MKRNYRIVLIVFYLVVSKLLLFAQTPPHPNGGNSPTGANGPVGGGASIGSGVILLTAMGIAYAALKFYQKRSKDSLKE